tara:strand:- start:515 stop:739 length:225 start_codon:yes stop_codon:yes gene_type:complete
MVFRSRTRVGVQLTVTTELALKEPTVIENTKRYEKEKSLILIYAFINEYLLFAKRTENRVSRQDESRKVYGNST